MTNVNVIILIIKKRLVICFY